MSMPQAHNSSLRAQFQHSQHMLIESSKYKGKTKDLISGSKRYQQGTQKNEMLDLTEDLYAAIDFMGLTRTI